MKNATSKSKLYRKKRGKKEIASERKKKRKEEKLAALNEKVAENVEEIVTQTRNMELGKQPSAGALVVQKILQRENSTTKYSRGIDPATLPQERNEQLALARKLKPPRAPLPPESVYQ